MILEIKLSSFVVHDWLSRFHVDLNDEKKKFLLPKEEDEIQLQINVKNSSSLDFLFFFHYHPFHRCSQCESRISVKITLFFLH